MIEVKDLHFSYGGRPILQGVSFTVEQGECVAVLGNNGAGKSTLVTCINRILRPQSGTVLVDGEDLGAMSRNALARTVSYVPQKNELSHTTVYDAVLLGRKPYFRWGASPEPGRSGPTRPPGRAKALPPPPRRPQYRRISRSRQVPSAHGPRFLYGSLSQPVARWAPL